MTSASNKSTATASLLAARTPAWLREPLLHFLLLGAVLFGADHLVNAGRADPRVIVIDASVDRQAREVFAKARGREPNAEELFALRRVWLDNEVLYREGLAMQMDRGDDAIRERVIFKSLSVVNAGLVRPPVDDQVLRAWFEKNRARYDEPTRYDFREAVPAGDATEPALRALAAALDAGDSSAAEQASLRVFTGRPHANLVQSYDERFAQRLAALPPGRWQVVPDRDGWRVVRLDAVTAARPAAFEPLRGVVLQDWTDAVLAEQRAAAVKAMAQKYTVVVRDGTAVAAR